MRTKCDRKVIAIGMAIFVVVAFVFLYVGGWTIVWKDHLWAVTSNMQEGKGFERRGYAILSNGFVVRVNKHCYGLAFKDRFFDAPVVSWILFFMAVGGVSTVIGEIAKEV